MEMIKNVSLNELENVTGGVLNVNIMPPELQAEYERLNQNLRIARGSHIHSREAAAKKQLMIFIDRWNPRYHK